MNALIALAVWCQPHGPVTILTTQHRRPVSSSSCSSSSSHLHQPQSINGTAKPSTSASTSTSTSATSLSPHVTTSPSSSSLDDPINSQAQTLDHQKKSRRTLQQHSPGGGGAGASNGSCPSPISSRPSSTSNSGPCECQFNVPSGEKSLHSVDPTNSELSYISQPAPVDSSLFAPIRIACIRSYVVFFSSFFSSAQTCELNSLLYSRDETWLTIFHAKKIVREDSTQRHTVAERAQFSLATASMAMCFRTCSRCTMHSHEGTASNTPS